MVLFFDIDPTVAHSRDGFGDEVMEKSDFQRAVYAQLQSIYNKDFWKVDISVQILVLMVSGHSGADFAVPDFPAPIIYLNVPAPRITT